MLFSAAIIIDNRKQWTGRVWKIVTAYTLALLLGRQIIEMCASTWEIIVLPSDAIKSFSNFWLPSRNRSYWKGVEESEKGGVFRIHRYRIKVNFVVEQKYYALKDVYWFRSSTKIAFKNKSFIWYSKKYIDRLYHLLLQ